MKFSEFEVTVRKRLKELPYREHMAHMGLGIVGEFGELSDAIKKFSIYGKGVDPNDMKTPMKVSDGGVLDTINLSEEVGDACWYIAGYLKELELSPMVLEVGFRSGFHDDFTDNLNDSELLVYLTGQVSYAAVMLMTPPDETITKPGSADAVGAVHAMISAVAVVCRRFKLDISEALTRNDAKLAKRYGEKFSEDSALNRNLEAERAALEGLFGVHSTAGSIAGSAGVLSSNNELLQDLGSLHAVAVETARDMGATEDELAALQLSPAAKDFLKGVSK